MKKGTKSLVLMTLLVAMGSMAVGQESFKDIVEQEGFSWMTGQWKATGDGQNMLMSYQWAVKGHAIITDFRMGEYSSHGIIHFVADEQQVRQFSVDSRGQAVKATWEVRDGKAIAKTRMTDEYGQATDVGIAYSKVDDTTMNVAIYGLDNGELSDSPLFEINFIKEKKKALLLVMGSVVSGQESLKDIVEQQGFAWMTGQWKSITDDGQDILLTYQWAVKGYAIVSNLKVGESSSQGMINFDADEQQVRQFSVDSRGRATNATWEVQDGKAIAKTKMTDEYGQATDVGIAYSKVNDTTMNVEIYGLDNGELSDSPWFELNFKKEKK